jgi:DNA-binding NtrC family response regulator
LYFPAGENFKKTKEIYPDQQFEFSISGETVLVVEDETIVRNLASKALQKAGYTVLTAVDGQNAIDVITNHRGKVDLVLTDVIMPRMNGRDLANFITKKYPKTRVLLMSGYTDDAVNNKSLINPDIQLISKPFTPQSLTVFVRHALDGKWETAKNQ